MTIVVRRLSVWLHRGEVDRFMRNAGLIVGTHAYTRAMRRRGVA